MRTTTLVFFIVAALAAASAVSGCARDVAPGNPLAGAPLSQMPVKTSLDIRGSDTMENLGAAWAEGFMKKTPGITIAVQGGGSGDGLNALINKNCDIAQSSRPAREDEMSRAKANGVQPEEIIVAFDGVGMIVNLDNRVSALTVDQLARIYRGEITNWKDVGGSDAPIVVLARDTASGTHVFIKEYVVQEQGSKKAAEYAKNAQFLASSQAIVREVSQNVNAIGYVGLGYLTGKVKTVGIKRDAYAPAVQPNVETVKNKTYELSRPLFFYTSSKPAGLMKDFVDWVLGPEGQLLVLRLDFVPVK